MSSLQLAGSDQLIPSPLPFQVLVAASGFLAQSLLFRNGIYIKSDCSSGSGERSSNEAKGTTPPAVKAAFKVYPNPVSQVLHIEAVTAFGEGMLRLLDFQGRTVLAQRLPPDSHQHAMDLGGIPPGIYFLLIQPYKGMPAQVKVVVAR